MICWILLLFILTSCVCASLVVNVTQSSYQAEENHNITLGWTFTPNTDRSLKSINIICEMFTDLRSFILFHLHEGVKVPESQDERFAGRVQFDKDVLREGRLRLLVSRLRTNDSGLYLCDMLTGYGEGSSRCRLNVTAVIKPNPVTTEPAPRTTNPAPEARGRVCLYVVLGLTAAAWLPVALL